MRVSPQVARLIREAPRELRLSAAQGALPLSGGDLLTVLFFLAHGSDGEAKTAALETLQRLPPAVLQPVVAGSNTHPYLLDLVARVRVNEIATMEPLLANPAVAPQTLARVAARAEGEILSLVVQNDERVRESPEIIEAILANPRADRALKLRFLSQEETVPALQPTESAEVVPVLDPAAGAESVCQTDEESGEGEPEPEGNPDGAEEINSSKYQLALQMEVAEKIKVALTGDKEWRNIFLKDTNKLVCSAVLKNPRITEGEVLTVAKNKSSNDELIRLITLNQEWIKNYEIQKALVYHPRTPLPKALRYMNVLTPKDLKSLAKSRGVAQVLVNNARRMVIAREKSR